MCRAAAKVEGSCGLKHLSKVRTCRLTADCPRVNAVNAGWGCRQGGSVGKLQILFLAMLFEAVVGSGALRPAGKVACDVVVATMVEKSICNNNKSVVVRCSVCAISA